MTARASPFASSTTRNTAGSTVFSRCFLPSSSQTRGARVEFRPVLRHLRHDSLPRGTAPSLSATPAGPVARRALRPGEGARRGPVTASRTRPSPAPSSPPARRPALVFDRDACHDLPAALAREWLETDGLGGYAALTSLFCPTRRQHGLLVTPYDGQPRRHVFLQRFEETLHVGDRAFPLSLARYPGLFAPHGHATLERFTAVPWPESLHRVGDVTLTREVLMARGTRGVLVRYRCTGAPGPVRLDLRLLRCRGADDLTHENAALNPRNGDDRRGPAGGRTRNPSSPSAAPRGRSTPRPCGTAASSTRRPRPRLRGPRGHVLRPASSRSRWRRGAPPSGSSPSGLADPVARSGRSRATARAGRLGRERRRPARAPRLRRRPPRRHRRRRPAHHPRGPPVVHRMGPRHVPRGPGPLLRARPRRGGRRHPRRVDPPPRRRPLPQPLRRRGPPRAQRRGRAALVRPRGAPLRRGGRRRRAHATHVPPGAPRDRRGLRRRHARRRRGRRRPRRTARPRPATSRGWTRASTATRDAAVALPRRGRGALGRHAPPPRRPRSPFRHARRGRARGGPRVPERGGVPRADVAARGAPPRRRLDRRARAADEIRRPNALIAAARPEIPLTARAASRRRARGRRRPPHAVGPPLARPGRRRVPPALRGRPRGDRDRAYHQGTVWPWWLGA